MDIGCGTGKSTVALKEFCTKTLGIDPSKAMLEKVTPEAGITYDYFNGLQINVKGNPFDISTLAGSWWYGKSQQLIDEILSVGKIGTPVLL